MNKLNQHEVQFDYFSSNYDQFEKDFYKYSALNVPLTFLIDDNNSNFFRLTANKSKDKRDHYFFFKVQTPLENKMVRIFQYIGHKFINEK